MTVSVIDEYAHSFQIVEEERENDYNTYHYEGPMGRDQGIREPGQSPTSPPHSPSASDHAILWLDDAEPPYNQWFDLFEFAAEWRLEASVLGKSWYNLGSTVQIVFYPLKRYR